MQIYGALAQRLGMSPGSVPAGGAYEPDTLYATDGIARKIVNRPAEDAMSRGFEIEVEGGDAKGTDITNELDRLRAGQAIVDALRWTRKDGGAVILMLCRDGGLLTSPLNLDRLDQVLALIPFPISSINPLSDNYDDPGLPNYGMPVGYTLTPKRGQPFDVHESRVLIIAGEALPYSANHGHSLPWVGVSELAACWEDLQRYRGGMNLAKQILVRKQQAVHAMAGLSDMLAASLEDVVRKRLDLADTARNIFNSVGIDAEDRFEVKDTSLAGIDAIIRVFMVALACSASMPLVILFGEDIKGLGSTGTGEQNIYHQTLTQIQERQVRPALERLVTVLWSQRAMPKRQPQKWRIVFNPLFAPTEGELADLSLKKAQALKTKVEAMAVAMMGMVTPDESRDYLATTEPDLNIEPGTAPPPMPENTEGEEEGTQA